MVVDVKKIPEQEEEVEDNFEELPLEEKLRIKTTIQDPPTDLEMKPLPKHLEYAFLEKDSLRPIVISALLKDDKKKRLVSVLKNHNETFAWKTSDISGISPSFCKHKINFEDDAKPLHSKTTKRPHSPFPMEPTPTRIWLLVFAMHQQPFKGYKVYIARLEVDKAKIDVISKLPPPSNVQAIKSFLGHAGFYRRFIKDFSKISHPVTKLLEKKSVFDFNEECIKAFETLKEKLTNAPIMVSPDWSQPFELMCDASDFTFGAVLGQREGKHFRPIHFASKTLNNAQQNDTVTEKVLLAVIKNKKGAKNVAADHLSRLENLNVEELKDADIDNFLDESLMNVLSNDEEIPWFADFANYLVEKFLEKD
ncbi:reverse transcriptase domain-containing protein [Tanacetum coccineum]|uniref:Reverse transcriptase domain-containing protein n=1 Tax=Tanacetum coccineum TaxID=301880 RepID=A0ABQ5CXB1_9ASTR